MWINLKRGSFEFLFAEKALPAGFPQIIQNPAMKVIFFKKSVIVIAFVIVNVIVTDTVKLQEPKLPFSWPGGGKSSPCCAGVRSFGKPEADHHMDQGHDAHRPEGQPEAQPDEAR